MQYEIVIGLEVHVQLKTHTKLFCSCSTAFGKKPNENTCAVCSGQPGALPVLNKHAVDLAIAAGLSLNCEVAALSVFSRKNYFYPDLPKAYQISQYDLPVCKNGWLEIDVNGTTKRIGITRAHLEEDAGKLVHQGADGIAGSTHSFVDLNRSSVPLLEIVSEPDIRSAEEARLYMEKIKTILQFAGVSDANMEEGKLRCDANISLRPVGQKEFGTRTEVKNMNSFKSVERAIISEVKRQEKVLNEGGTIIQETRNYHDDTGETTSMRSKEEAHDYRYFPEPDLLPLKISPAWIVEIRKHLPDLPDVRKKKYREDLGLSAYDARVLTLDKEISDFFEAVKSKVSNVKNAVNWITGDVMGILNVDNSPLHTTKLTVDNFVAMLQLIDKETISGKIAKDLLPNMIREGTPIEKLVEQSGMTQISDESVLQEMIQKIIIANPKQTEQYKAGKTALLGYFVGQLMKETKGRAKPELANKLFQDLLK